MQNLCILIQCDKRVSKKVKRFFAQKHVLEDLQPHFRVHVIDTGLIQLSEGDLVTVRGNLAAPSGTWCGMAIEMRRRWRFKDRYFWRSSHGSNNRENPLWSYS